MPPFALNRGTPGRLIRAIETLGAALALMMFCGCGPPSISRSEMNPRKEKIYKYAASLAEVDQQSSVMGTGGQTHPLRLLEPYPTQAEMETAIGPADFSQMESVGELHPLKDEGAMLTLYWWEKDSSWEIPGLKKHGYREIVIARFDRNGRLRMLEVLDLLGYQLIGRSSWEWHWMG